MEHGVSCTRDHHITIPVNSEIELQGVCVADCADCYAAIDRNRAHLRRWLPWLTDGYNEQSVLQFLQQKELENARGVSLTLHIRFQGEICGAIGLHDIKEADRNTSIGYWLDERFTGRGIMTRACRALVSEGFRNYNLHRIEIRCATGNEASCAIPRRLGFQEEGRLREAEWLYDHWVDLLVFSVLEQEWQEK